MFNRILRLLFAFLISILIFYLPLNIFFDAIKCDEFYHSNYVWLLSSDQLSEVDFIDITYIESWDCILAVSKSNNIYCKSDFSEEWEKLSFKKSSEIKKVLLDPKGLVAAIDDTLSLYVKDNLTGEWNKILLPNLQQTSNFDIFLVNKNLICINSNEIWICDTSNYHLINFPNHNHLKVLCLQLLEPENQLLAGTKGNGLWTIDLLNDSQEKNLSIPENTEIETIFISSNEYNASLLSDSYGYIYRSKDNGVSWERLNQIGPKIKVYSFCEDPTTLEVFFAFTNLGIFLTYNSGEDWIPMQNGIENIPVLAGFYHPVYICFYVATLGKGIRKSFEVPNPPKPLLPKDGDEVFSFKPGLAWQLFGGRDLPGLYHVVVSSNKDFQPIAFEKSNIIGDFIIIPENTLKLHTYYYWKVRVGTPYWTSEWSETSCFILRQKWIMTPNQPSCQWNEKRLLFDEEGRLSPFITQRTFYIPLRAFMESQNALVFWNEKKREATVLFKEKKVIFSADSNFLLVEDKQKLLIDSNPDVKTIIKYNRIFVPIRTLSNLYGWTLEWDSKINAAIIIEPNP
ncbi:MAG: copper amine oxidase N-terminal domain-containing protein [Caldisericia bacterium]|nr:copper amine oxidase N-terminal domain-containing protein [Caldisericia bacterium]MDD5688997.1 copper amine oxidase N-terminal domain-containing protein [Caldisericia bacterium]